jgi:hypothetical protein
VFNHMSVIPHTFVSHVLGMGSFCACCVLLMQRFIAMLKKEQKLNQLSPFSRDWGGAVSVVVTLQGRRPRNQSLIPGKCQRFSVQASLLSCRFWLLLSQE